MKSGLFKKKDPLKLHLACGPNIVAGWENIDILDSHDIKKHDLTEPLPYKTGTVDAIFHEHFIEHLEKVQGRAFLTECYRVLKPGSAMRVGWPDLAKLISAYNTQDSEYYDYVRPAVEHHTTGDWDEIFSDCLFSWEHRYAYTAKYLTTVLQEIGFKEVVIRKYKNSRYGIDLDFRNDPATTYLEMIK